MREGKRLMKKSLKFLQFLVMSLLLSVLVSGCETLETHYMNEKAVYVVPPEGLPFGENGLMYETKDGYKRVVGAGYVPAGWLIVSPE
jgi:hypothetical protein